MSFNWVDHCLASKQNRAQLAVAAGAAAAIIEISVSPHTHTHTHAFSCSTAAVLLRVTLASPRLVLPRFAVCASVESTHRTLKSSLSALTYRPTDRPPDRLDGQRDRESQSIRHSHTHALVLFVSKSASVLFLFLIGIHHLDSSSSAPDFPRLFPHLPFGSDPRSSHRIAQVHLDVSFCRTVSVASNHQHHTGILFTHIPTLSSAPLFPGSDISLSASSPPLSVKQPALTIVNP